jgi:hypothetical protein
MAKTQRLLDLYRAERAFHQINLEQQNMRLLHARPYIFAVDDFLSPDECKLLIEKAESASLKKQDFERAPGRARTSFGCIARNEEVSGLRHRIAHLARVELSQLQPLKLTRYEAGQVPVPLPPRRLPPPVFLLPATEIRHAHGRVQRRPTGRQAGSDGLVVRPWPPSAWSTRFAARS